MEGDETEIEMDTDQGFNQELILLFLQKKKNFLILSYS